VYSKYVQWWKKKFLFHFSTMIVIQLSCCIPFLFCKSNRWYGMEWQL